MCAFLFETISSGQPGVKAAYRRGRCEVSPGPFLAIEPGATGVTVVCDRWLDSSDLRQFGLDAIRLSGARTDHEKALAVWRWVRRWTMYTDGNPPQEHFENPRQSEKNGYIDDPIKVLNVYGAHWCDGLSRVVEAVWRALGYRAEKLYRAGHTMVNCYYRDTDGVERWHVFDVSEGRFALDHTATRVLDPYEMSTDWYCYMFGWVHCPHVAMPTHRMELSLRLGESLQRSWGNWGKPYQDNVRYNHQTVPEWERGPYPVGFGNGVWIYKPDLTQPVWTNGLAEPPRGLAAGHLMPARVGETGTAVWHFRTPYIVSDAAVRLCLRRDSPEDSIKLCLSVDDGTTWKTVWECSPQLVGEADVVVPICPKFKVGGNRKPPAEFVSPFGRYRFRVKLELFAAREASACRVDSIEFRTTVQHNYYALPQLQPGRNRITVRGRLTPAAALRITYEWDDPAGKQRRNVAVVEQTPFTYDIVVAGKKWSDCVCRQLLIECIPATGEGNRVEVKESPAEFADLPALPPAELTRQSHFWHRPLRKTLPPLERLIEQIADPVTAPLDQLNAAVRGLMELRDPRAFEALKRVVYEENRKDGPKLAALTALYVSDRERSRPVFLHLLQNIKNAAWRRDDPDNPAYSEGHWCSAAALIGQLAADAGWKEFAPLLCNALRNPHLSEMACWGLLDALGRLGAAESAEEVRRFLQHENLDTVQVAALAAGRLKDREAIPRLRELLNSSYPPVRFNAALALGMLSDKASAPRLRSWLTREDDENYRGVAAEVLGKLRDEECVGLLSSGEEGEPFPWVQAKIKQALEVLTSSRPTVQ